MSSSASHSLTQRVLIGRRPGGYCNQRAIQPFRKSSKLDRILLELRQDSRVSKQVHSGRFIVFALAFDGADFRMKLKKKSRCCHADLPVLASHGRLVCGTERRDALQEEEVVIRPMLIEANSAACYWAAFQASIPPVLWDLFQGRLPEHHELGAICSANDEGSANSMLLANLDNTAGDCVLVFKGWCRQHGTGNCLQPVVKRLGVLNPSFCLARRMRNNKFQERLLKGVRKSVASNPVYIRGSEDPLWRPDEADGKRNAELLELAYYTRDLRNSSAATAAKDESTPEAANKRSECLEKRRRELGGRLLRYCPGDWRGERVLIWDPDNEFANVDEAVEYVVELLEDMGLLRPAQPAENKWLSVWPLLCDLSVHLCFYGMIRRGFRLACGVERDEDKDLSPFDEGEIVGNLTKEAFLKRERRREMKGLTWLESDESRFRILLFVTLAKRVMRLHFKFFKHCQVTPRGGKRSLIFEICSGDSVVMVVIDELMDLMLPSSCWGPIEAVFGPFASWPAARRRLAEECVYTLVGELVRRCVKPYRRPPFKHLVPLADPLVPIERKRTVANEIFDADPRGLDANLLKIRRHFGSAEDLVQPLPLEFFFHAVNQIGLSSAFVECIFAQFNQWMPSRSIYSGPALQSKHVNHRCMVASAEERLRQGIGLGTNAKQRPAWVFKRGEEGKANSRHMLIKKCINARPPGETVQNAFRKAVASYRGTTPAAKAKAKARHAECDMR